MQPSIDVLVGVLEVLCGVAVALKPDAPQQVVALEDDDVGVANLHPIVAAGALLPRKEETGLGGFGLLFDETMMDCCQDDIDPKGQELGTVLWRSAGPGDERQNNRGGFNVRSPLHLSVTSQVTVPHRRLRAGGCPTAARNRRVRPGAWRRN